MIEINLNLKVSIIIPAYNEEKLIDGVIRCACEVEEVDEILVVDDGSEDKTKEVAKKAGVRVVSHLENMGKGKAMDSGCRNAKGDILIYLDADLKNLSPSKIKKIIDPFRHGYDFIKTRFDRRGGRVTQLTALPLLSHFFPEIGERFDQPLSGQIGIKKDLMMRLDLEEDMGVDIGILIDIFQMGVNTKEVYFGRLSHDEKKLEELQEMAKAVSRVILDRAARYNRTHPLEDIIVNPE
jgi:glucosyl-3-phosphoglycerate synthase